MLEFAAGLALLVLIVTWAVYPLGIWLLSRLYPPVRRGPGETGEAPLVSVVVASREPAAAIRARVENLLDTDHDGSRVEVVVALDRDGSAAADAVLTTLDARIRCVARDGSGKAAALNAGVAAASGEIVVFADTYQRFDRTTIPRLVAGLRRPGVGVVSGSLELPGSRASLTRAYWLYERWLRRCEARVHSTVGATGAVYAMYRALWMPLPAGLLLDDVYAPMRVVLGGHRVGFMEDAVARELRQSAPRSEYRRKVRTLTGVMQVCAWLPSVLVPWRNPVWAQFILHKLARMLTPYAVAVLALWAMVRGVQLLEPLLLPLFIASAAVAAWAVVSRSARAARLRDLVIEGTLLQAAVVVAGFNGLRGRWEVWNG